MKSMNIKAKPWLPEEFGVRFSRGGPILKGPPGPECIGPKAARRADLGWVCLKEQILPGGRGKGQIQRSGPRAGRTRGPGRAALAPNRSRGQGIRRQQMAWARRLVTNSDPGPRSMHAGPKPLSLEEGPRQINPPREVSICLSVAAWSNPRIIYRRRFPSGLHRRRHEHRGNVPPFGRPEKNREFLSGRSRPPAIMGPRPHRSPNKALGGLSPAVSGQAGRKLVTQLYTKIRPFSSVVRQKDMENARDQTLWW